MTTVSENELLARMVAGFPRSPLQLNAHQESDAELLRLPGRSEILVLQTDSIAEEIESGLYEDPYQIGWMTILVNASDLAAVGAVPIGVLLHQTLPREADEEYIARLQDGIRDACESCGFRVLGGDTNRSARPQMGATALGIIQDGRVVTRRGCRVGDQLFASGPLGAGSQFAFQKLLGRGPGPQFLPQPRIGEGRLVRRFATASMDTSDGALAALDQMLRINEIGFHIDLPLADLLTPGCVPLCTAAGIPIWSPLAGPHGEFELVFTIPSNQVAAFRTAASATGWEPIRIGSVTATPEIRLRVEGGSVVLDTGRIRNLFTESDEDPQRYLVALKETALAGRSAQEEISA